MKSNNCGTYNSVNLKTLADIVFLRGLIGVEFAVAVDQGPSLFIIHKRRRVSPDQSEPPEPFAP